MKINWKVRFRNPQFIAQLVVPGDAIIGTTQTSNLRSGILLHLK